MSSRRGQPAGFTLLELLVATGITAVLAGSLYATLHIAFRARRSALAAVEPVRKTELALELVRADIETAVVPRGILAGEFLGKDATDGAGHASDTLVLHCVADAALDKQGIGDIRMVEFGCRADENGQGMVLYRRVTVHLLATRVEQPAEEVLCRGVRAFGLRYFDGMDWLDNWDSALQDNNLPIAAEVTLELMPEDGMGADVPGHRASRVFRIACSTLTTGLQIEMTP
ncbi:MAG TPA: type II secretion system protein GspJ [Phycisphaerae bacterium]|nr:type II secretion system protein GspJ [Phycisphaerae bacterium]